MADINMSASELYGLAVKLGKDLQKQKKANEKLKKDNIQISIDANIEIEKLNKENKYQRQVMDTGNKVMEIAIKNNDKLSEEIIKKDKIINNYKKKLQEMLMEQFEEEEKFTCVNCHEDNFNEEDGPELDVEKFGGWVCEHCYDYLVDGVEE